MAPTAGPPAPSRPSGGRRNGKPVAADRRRDDEVDGGQAVASSTASRSSATRRRATTSSGARSGCSKRCVQHRGAEVQHQAAQPARLLQGARRRRRSGSRRRRAPTTRSTSAQARGAEPQPADVRRRRVAVRRLLRTVVVPDLELPRPRRNVQRHRAAGQPRQELSGGVHRAVPVRPADDCGRRPLHPGDPLHRDVHAGLHGRQSRLRVPDGVASRGRS